MLLYLAYLFILIGFFLIVLHITWRKWTENFRNIDGPSNIPWLGSAPYLELDPFKFFMQLQSFVEEYNFFFLLWIGFKPLICSGRKEHAEVVLSSKDVIRKSTLYHFVQDWLGTGLLLSWGEKWRKRRKIITPSFHFSILNDFTSIFVRHSNILVDKLKLLSDGVVDVQQIIRLATLDVICETAMGVKLNAQLSESEYVEAIEYVNKHLIVRIRSPWLWPEFIYKLTSDGNQFYSKLNILHEFTTNVINQNIKARKVSIKSSEVKKKAFLDLLLDLYDKGEIDVEGIREEVDTFMFEGHDTTASAISWILYLLGRNLSAQDKLQKEIDLIAAVNDDGDITKKIWKLKYMEYVIKEGLRLHPPVPFFGRVLDEDKLIGGIPLPKGTEIVISPFALHMNPEYWSDPLEFRPERFCEEEFLSRNPYTYVPFSAGPRNCIGQKFAMMEMKVLIYHIILNFSVRSLQSEVDIQCCVDIIHKSQNGLLLKFLKR